MEARIRRDKSKEISNEKSPVNGEETVYTLTPTPAANKGTKTLLPMVYRLGAVLNLFETRNVEFKTGPYAIDNLQETIEKYGSAFLNSGGGTLLFGVLDNGKVVGMTFSQYSLEDLRRSIIREFDRFTPPVAQDLYDIVFSKTDARNKYVVELHVKPGIQNEIYVGRTKKMFIRRDGSVQGPIWPRNIEEIVLEKIEKKDSSSSDTTGSN